MKPQVMEYQDIIKHTYPDIILHENNQMLCPDITFQITDACNLKCSYCYQINKGQHVMPLSIAKKFIDLILNNEKTLKQYIDFSYSKGIVLNFIGGEPLLQIDLIEEIVDYFITQTIIKNHPFQLHYQIGICSNGVLYFDPKFQNFLKKHFNNISFNISIDGNKELHDSCRKFPNGEGSYDIAISGVRHFKNILHGQMGSKMTLAPENINFMANALINLINENYTDIRINCVFEKGWDILHAQIFYQELKKISNYLLENNLEDQIYISLFNENMFHPKPITDIENWCGGNARMLAIDWKGDLYPCIRYMESSLGHNVKPIIIGNINNGIMSTPECQQCINQLKAVNRITQSTQECLQCPIAEGCSWCQAYNYQDSGNFNHRATYICIMHKARALGNVYFWNKYYQKHKINNIFQNYLPDIESLRIISKEELELLNILQNK